MSGLEPATVVSVVDVVAVGEFRWREGGTNVSGMVDLMDGAGDGEGDEGEGDEGEDGEGEDGEDGEGEDGDGEGDEVFDFN